MYLNFLIWNNIRRYREPSQKRKFSIVCVIQSPVKIKKEGSTRLNVSTRTYKKLPLGRRTVASSVTIRFSLHVHWHHWNCLPHKAATFNYSICAAEASTAATLKNFSLVIWHLSVPWFAPAPFCLESSSESRNCNPELHSTFRINSARLWSPTVCKPCEMCD